VGNILKTNSKTCQRWVSITKIFFDNFRKYGKERFFLSVEIPWLLTLPRLFSLKGRLLDACCKALPKWFLVPLSDKSHANAAGAFFPQTCHTDVQYAIL